MSPYLHFGQLSAQRVALEASKLKKKHSSAVESFLEELIVRRELADNYCHFNPAYDTLDGLYPQFDNNSWAQVGGLGIVAPPGSLYHALHTSRARHWGQ